MPITSMIVECLGDATDEVASFITQIPGAEVANRKDNFLVVVTDTLTRTEDRAIMSAVSSLDGIICATPVFTNREDVPLMPGEDAFPPEDRSVPASLEV